MFTSEYIRAVAKYAINAYVTLPLTASIGQNNNAAQTVNGIPKYNRKGRYFPFLKWLLSTTAPTQGSQKTLTQRTTKKIVAPTAADIPYTVVK